MDFLNFFVCNIEKPIVWCSAYLRISAKENYYNLTKNSRKFPKGVLVSVNDLKVLAKVFKSTYEKAESLKNFY